ncbi:hypothetical protein JXA48_02665 [Candidatus Woesearchaeota archaeon]|nr:hypothetical protein [Candidatus Woesearchaeota archaeon]
MENAEVKEQVQRLKDLRVQVSALKKELNKLNREKESWYSKRSEVNKKITDLIGGVKGSKDERNELSGKVKELKEQRDELNKEINEKAAELKALKDNYDSKVGSSKTSKEDNPALIKKQLERLDYVMQTQPMSFDKEQKMMKEIKSLRKKLDEMSSVVGDWEKISVLTKEVNKLRRKSNTAHRQIQRKAANSQTKHENVIEQSKEIDALKEEEQGYFEKFKEYKDLFTEKNNKLKELLKETDELRGVLQEADVKIDEDKKRQEQINLKEKAKEVNEKVKTGKKLTTEDLLIFQKSLGK